MEENEFQKRLVSWREGRGLGASELARVALEMVAESADKAPADDSVALTVVLRDRAARLIKGRPSMTPVRNLLARWQDGLESLPDDLAGARKTAHDSASALAQLSRNAANMAAVHAANTIGPNQTIITVSLSSTVRAVFERLRGRGVRAIVCESRPLYEGHKLAKTLSEWSIKTTMITEAQMGLFVAKADVALVGADTLLLDGSVVNKAGTYLLALAARDQGIPLYVCCESFKRRHPDMGELGLEWMDPGELGAPALPHLQCANIYFDTTPAALVNALFTEEGRQ
jgi:translation initiation factor 2B subunit (eIF-2B alpha/beta/delta family)